MFKSLKSKILIVAIIMLAFLMLVFACFAIIARMKTKQLMVQNYGASISEYVEEIQDSVLKAEDNLKSLSLIGSLFYKTDRSTELTDKVIIRIFENYPDSLGGGIWFKPYIVDKNKKYVCFYAFRDKNNKISLDRNFESKEYDYPNQEWYKQIISQVTPERNIVWTKPYYEEIGSKTQMVTAGTGIYVDGELVGIATVDWKLNNVIENVSNMKPLEKTFSLYDKERPKIKNSFAMLGDMNHDFIIATSDPYLDNEALVGHSLKDIPWYADNLYAITYITYHGKKYIPFFREIGNGLVLVICIPKIEMFKEINKFYLYIILVMLAIGFIIPALLYYCMNCYIINPIDKLTEIAHKIGKGEDVKIKISKPKEFAQLAETFDKMTTDIKEITKDKAKISSELSIAKSIQSSSLPNIFPPFPDVKEFDIFASMETAKEVGGDFYDFFFINETKFMFLIADVSGKGIPAALFMMTVKTLINNLAQIDYTPEQLIKNINKKICQNNKEGFFVTLLSGILDIKTGELNLINCGHNLPLIKRVNANYEFLNLNPNMALGTFDDTEFEIYKTILNSGDIIFTYTDGVTEATNINDEMYGEKRLIKCLNDNASETEVNEIAHKIKDSINEYVTTAPQSDDITMLIFKYNGNNGNNIKMFKEKAIQENYTLFYTWLHDTIKEWNLNSDLANKLDMCAEEIFANIAFYAYPEKNGFIEAEIEKTNNNIIFKFKDNGIEYNPLEKPDPDISLPPEERPLGGLGIFMVKEMTDEITYNREDNQNILTLIFKL